MTQELPTINGELLRLRRETRGWALSDLATRACMSIKQIRQLEEGGSSAFYSETVKWTSAKKVGSLLGMQPDEVFVQVAPEVVSPPPGDGATHSASATAVAPELESIEVAAPVRQAELVDVATDASVEATASLETSQTSKTPVLALVALFVAALAVAAWMRPEPEVVSEPVPALQNITAESSDAAPASAAAVDASATVASQPQKLVLTPASAASPALASASATASVAAASASTPRAVTPAASAVQAPAAIASAASKPL